MNTVSLDTFSTTISSANQILSNFPFFDKNAFLCSNMKYIYEKKLLVKKKKKKWLHQLGAFFHQSASYKFIIFLGSHTPSTNNAIRK